MSVYFGNERISIQLNRKSSNSETGPNLEYAKANYEKLKSIVTFAQTTLDSVLASSEHGYIGIRRNTEFDVSETFTLDSSGIYKVVTSDGSTYTYDSDGSSVSHTWDTSKGLTIGGEAIRYVICYSTKTQFAANDTACLDYYKACNFVYVFAANLAHNNTTSASITRNCKFIEGIDFIRDFSFIAYDYIFYDCSNLGWCPCNITFNGNAFKSNHAFSGCNILYELPDCFDGIKANADAYQCFGYCYNLHEIPEIDFSQVTSFANSFSYCQGLQALPTSLDTSNATTLQNFCQYCTYLKSLPELNTSKCTAFGGFCRDTGLTSLPTLDTSNGTNFSYFLADSSLTSLPSIDTSKGTNMSYFCQNACIQHLPATISLSSATTAAYFCYNCAQLQDIPETLSVGSACTTVEGMLQNCVQLKHPNALSFSASATTNFKNFMHGCVNLVEIPGGISTTAGTNFNWCMGNSPGIVHSDQTIDLTNATNTYGLLLGSTALRYVKIILPKSASLALNFSSSLDVSMMRWIADNAPTITTTLTLTLGSTNIARANAADSTIVSDLQAKGWTVA